LTKKSSSLCFVFFVFIIIHLIDMAEELDAKILKQVEFYFGDSNLRNDKFMKSQMQLDPQGYVALATLTTFNRLKQLTTDVAVIANALKPSILVQISEDGKMVKKAQPLVEDEATSERTVYSKGWPKQTTLEQATQFYSAFGKVLMVRLRRHKNKEFKGSLLVEFTTKEEAVAALAAAPQPEGSKLLYMSKVQWEQEKREQQQQHQQHLQMQKDQKEKEKEDSKKKKTEVFSQTKVAGVIVKFDGVGDGVKRDTVKELCMEHGEVAFVDYPAGQTFGYVRFKTPEAASTAVQTLNEKHPTLGEQTPKWELLDIEHEKQYWENVNQEQKPKKGGMRGKGKGKGKRGFAGGSSSHHKKQKK